jgi:phosphoribosylglycinamide formyltransferase-1
MRRIGVLISGRGSNLQALIDAQKAQDLGGGEIVLVISNVPRAHGLARARAAGIPTQVCEHKGKAREAYDRELLALLEEQGVELVCLAGFMRLLSPVLVRAFPGRILNIHPALLPSFPGLDAQRQALEHGVKVSGATVHLVTEDLDAGPIVVQQTVPVRDNDTAETLAARILAVEHQLYPRAVRTLLAGGYRVEGRRFVAHGGTR